MTFDDYRPQAEWFAHNPFGIHGIGHVARVLVWAEQIAGSLVDAGKPVDMQVVRWSSILHDVGRINDGYDPGHGSMSAEWITSHRESLPPIDNALLQEIVYSCIWHVPPDHSIPVMTPELMCLKDADGLERVRIRDLDPSYLRTDYARSQVRSAEVLYRASIDVNTQDLWNKVRDAAIRHGWWK